MTENDQHMRDLQREYLDFLDDEVSARFSIGEQMLSRKSSPNRRRTKEFTRIR